MDFEGADNDYVFKKDFYDNTIKLIPKNNTIKVKLNIYNFRTVDEFTIYFYDNKIAKFKNLYITSIVFGSVCFVIMAVYLLKLYINYQDENKCPEDFDCFKEKILSVYLCQNYDFLNKRIYLEH